MLNNEIFEFTANRPAHVKSIVLNMSIKTSLISC